jgi:hypothetical protein
MSRKTTLRRALTGYAITVALAASLAGCAEIESVTVEPYEPAALESTGPDKPARVILTEEGKPWVFTVAGPRTYVRAPIGIKNVEDNVAILSSGPPAGTRVVTVGAIELWGAELGIAGKH